MTNTLKELKEPDANVLLTCPFCGKKARTWRQGYVGKKLASCSDSECGAYFSKNGFTIEEWNTRNALQELIRVIELAESKLSNVEKTIKELKTDEYGRFRPTKAQGEAIWFSLSQALSEIRKLKGE